MLLTYTTGTFSSDSIPTAQDNTTTDVIVDNKLFHLSLFDTYSRPEYDRLRPTVYPGTDVVLLCFSIASPPSLESVSTKWLPEVKQHCPKAPFILVGLKVDLKKDLQEKGMELVSTEKGQQKAQEIGAKKYIECSALANEGIKTTFDEALRATVAPKRKKCILV